MTQRVGLDIRLESHSNLASHMGRLGEMYDDGQELDELEEQLDKSVEDCLGLDESVHGTLTSSG